MGRLCGQRRIRRKPEHSESIVDAHDDHTFSRAGWPHWLMPRNMTSFGAGPKFAPCSVPESMVADDDLSRVAITSPWLSTLAVSCE
jgi:hypothetical protein